MSEGGPSTNRVHVACEKHAHISVSRQSPQVSFLLFCPPGCVSWSLNSVCWICLQRILYFQFVLHFFFCNIIMIASKLIFSWTKIVQSSSNGLLFHDTQIKLKKINYYIFFKLKFYPVRFY